jgi:DNA polymerase I-like protein with 3'-5' exonuclease and polymerase domains
MHFVHDPASLSYYLGEQELVPGFTKKLLEQSYSIVAIDVETISLKERIPIGIGIALSPTTAFYFQLFPQESQAVPWHLVKDSSITKVYHNSIFDLAVLREYEPDMVNILDTNIMARLLCYKFTGLLELSFLHQMEVHDIKEYLPKGGTTLNVDQAVIAKKCMQDAMATYKLNQMMAGSVDMDYLSVEMQVVPICIEMSYRGLLIDQEMRQQVEEQLQEQADYYYGICEEIGFNPGSPQQVAYVLAKRGAYSKFAKLPFTRGRGRRNLSSAKEILKQMDDPLASVVLTYRDYSKLLSTYIKPWAHDQRAYTRFHLDAITGRPSSTERNMQNIPGKFRKDGTAYPVNCRGVLLPDNGVWTDVDWEQLEPRVLAYLSGDREMSYIFSQPKFNPDGSRNEDGDIHFQVAKFINIDRKLGKTINLAMSYGATDQTLSEESGIHNVGRIKELKAMWARKFPQAWDWIESRQEDALRTGMARTVFGRNIRLPTEDEESIDGIRRKAIDYPCQGSAAEILKRGLIKLKDLDLSLQVHDEILIDSFVPAYLLKPLEHIAPFHTPVEVHYLDRWE